MYLDNTNLLRRPRRHSHWKFRQDRKAAQPVYSNAGLHVVGIEHKLDEFDYYLDLSEEQVLIALINALWVYRGIKVVFTKLDLMQTSKQLQRNKYYKSFIGEKQLIQNYE